MYPHYLLIFIFTICSGLWLCHIISRMKRSDTPSLGGILIFIPTEIYKDALANSSSNITCTTFGNIKWDDFSPISASTRRGNNLPKELIVAKRNRRDLFKVFAFTIFSGFWKSPLAIQFISQDYIRVPRILQLGMSLAPSRSDNNNSEQVTELKTKLPTSSNSLNIRQRLLKRNRDAKIRRTTGESLAPEQKVRITLEKDRNRHFASSQYSIQFCVARSPGKGQLFLRRTRLPVAADFAKNVKQLEESPWLISSTAIKIWVSRLQLQN